MKRFYKTAGVDSAEDGWRVALDGRPVRTPAGKPLAVPTQAAAQCLADEWDAQGETVRPHAMPLTRLINVALDRTPEAREAIADEVAKYGETDAVCHTAEAPEALCERQAEAWTPLRDWAAQDIGVRLVPAAGVLPTPQPQASLDRLKALALELDDIRLTALAHACALLGSAVLALALLRGRLNAEAAYDLSALDAAWQQEQWGVDEEAAAREAEARAELAALETLLAAL